MKEIVADTSLIARCGLYCGACKRYLREKCPGCFKNEKASWCKVRSCCLENNYASCADCKLMDDIADCKKLNNFMAKIFAFVFRSNREACLRMITEKGLDGYAEHMTQNRIMTIKR